jgi:hypothetical protein
MWNKSRCQKYSRGTQHKFYGSWIATKWIKFAYFWHFRNNLHLMNLKGFFCKNGRNKIPSSFSLLQFKPWADMKNDNLGGPSGQDINASFFYQIGRFVIAALWSVVDIYFVLVCVYGNKVLALFWRMYVNIR